MYRLLLLRGSMCLNRADFGTKTNDLTRHICMSLSCLKHSRITDDLNETPTYCENRYTKKLSKHLFMEYLEQTLTCPTTLAAEICIKYPAFRERSLNDIKQNVDLLIQKGVTKSIIVDNPWMLTIKNDSLCSRLSILEEMKPENVKDFVPLAVFEEKKLMGIMKIAREEEGIVRSKHRIYHFSELLAMQPHTFSKHATKRLYLLKLPFEDVDKRIKIMLNYKTPEEVVRNLHFVKCTTTRVESRLAEAKQLNTSLNVHISEKSWSLLVKKSKEIKTLLGGRSLAQFYSDRLHIDIRTAESLLELHPSLRRSNVLVIDEKLNYLLNEVGIKLSDIAECPNVLTIPLQRIKERIQELQLCGCESYRIMSVIYHTTKPYDKYLLKLKEERMKNGL